MSTAGSRCEQPFTGTSVAADFAWLGVGAVLQFVWRRLAFGEWTSVSMQIEASPTSLALRLQNNLIGLCGSNLCLDSRSFVSLFARDLGSAQARHTGAGFVTSSRCRLPRSSSSFISSSTARLRIGISLPAAYARLVFPAFRSTGFDSSGTGRPRDDRRCCRCCCGQVGRRQPHSRSADCVVAPIRPGNFAASCPDDEPIFKSMRPGGSAAVLRARTWSAATAW